MDWRAFSRKFPGVQLPFLVEAIKSADPATLEYLTLAFGYGRCVPAFVNDINNAHESASVAIRASASLQGTAT